MVLHPLYYICREIPSRRDKLPYCSKCGTEVDYNAQYCPKCGAPQSTGSYQPAPQRPVDSHDSGSIGWFILGFFVNIVGLILFLVWINDRPKDAKMAGLGALVSVIMGLVFTIVYVAVIMVMLSDSGTNAILALL